MCARHEHLFVYSAVLGILLVKNLFFKLNQYLSLVSQGSAAVSGLNDRVKEQIWIFGARQSGLAR